MKLWLKLCIILAVWLGIAALVTARIYFVQGGSGGESFVDLFLAQLPGWLLWAAMTPLILLIPRFFPFRMKPILWIAPLLVVFSFVTAALYAGGFALVDALLSGAPLIAQPLLDAAVRHFSGHWIYLLAIYWIVVAAAYGLRPFFAGKPAKQKRAFENSILIKTNYGFVVVEIERFQYVKGGGKRIMFHTTGRSRHLDRNREALAKGTIVEESRYRPDRRIVIDLGKIRRAEQTADNRFVFHIGYSHEIYLGQDYYQKLGGWLPTPVITYSRKETS